MTTSSKTPALFFTFNCSKKAPLCAEFTKELDTLLPTLAEASQDGNERVVPEILAFAFQELSTNLDGTNYAEINSLLIQVGDEITKNLSERYETPFATVSINHFGAIGLVLISPFPSRFKNIQLSKDSPTGYYFTSTKGSTGIRFEYGLAGEEEGSDATLTMTVIALHLNAGESLVHVRRRNKDLLSIARGMTFPDGSGAVKAGSHLFMMGDFNYRATGGYYSHFMRDQEQEQQPAEEGEGHGESGPHMIDGEFDFSKDELSIIMKHEKAMLTEFQEAPVTFAPTYKFKTGTTFYNYKRTPSWCDRILYVDYTTRPPKDEPNYEIVEYNSLPSLQISDHIPVYLKVKIPARAPERIINADGYLVDRSTRLADMQTRLVPDGRYRLYRKVGQVTDHLFGDALFVTTTPQGRVLLCAVVVCGYLLYRYMLVK